MTKSYDNNQQHFIPFESLKERKKDEIASQGRDGHKPTGTQQEKKKKHSLNKCISQNDALKKR